MTKLQENFNGWTWKNCGENIGLGHSLLCFDGQFVGFSGANDAPFSAIQFSLERMPESSRSGSINDWSRSQPTARGLALERATPSSHFVSALALIALLAFVPSVGIAQSAKKIPRVGLIANAGPLDQMKSTPASLAFQSELIRLGWRPGLNIEILWRSLEGDPARIPGTLDDLLRREVDVIVLGSNFIAGEARKKTRTVAIVTLAAFDPVGTGLASDLRRPGANITGVISEPDAELAGKRFALFREILPGLARLAIFSWDHPVKSTPSAREGHAAFERMAQRLGISLLHYQVKDAEEMEAALADAKRERADGALLTPASIFTTARAQRLINAYAGKQRMPVMHSVLSGAEMGGLIAYGPRQNANHEKAAQFVDRILKGVKPGDIPFEQVGNYSLYVNKRAARAIGLTIPVSILVQADKVIE